jgi:hypothetical protein
MNLKTSELPAVLRNLVKGSKLARCRKFLVLCVGPAQAINDGSIVATLNGAAVEQVPYHQGGGSRTSAPMYVVQGFGGCNFIAVVRPEGFGYSYVDAAQVAVACDWNLERVAVAA